MSSCREGIAAAVLVFAAFAAAAQGSVYPGIGRAATAQEVAAWDIDVRPDFKGLPKGSGSVAQGMEVWEAKCASCHGVFGESNEVFFPLVGGTTQDDVARGRTAHLRDNAYPGRTTLMKLAQVSTLWDYINRAMPWNQPKSLTADEVYAVTAYLLNLGSIVPAEFTLSDRNIADVQALLPNRNGLSTDHGLWPGRGLGNGGKPDVRASACMKDCAAEPRIASRLPEHARDAHGNLADQNRLVGAQRGAQTVRTAARSSAAITPPPSPPPAAVPVSALLAKHNCSTCHGIDRRVVGPGFKEIVARYRGRGDAEAYYAGKIQSGGQGVWGPVAMPPQTLPEADLKAIVQWLGGLAAP